MLASSNVCYKKKRQSKKPCSTSTFLDVGTYVRGSSSFSIAINFDTF